jgi:hypothetical protein
MLIRFILGIVILFVIHTYVTSVHTFTDNEFTYLAGIALLVSCGGHSLRNNNFGGIDSLGVLFFAISMIWGFISYNWYIPMYGFWVLGLVLELISSSVINIIFIKSGIRINGFRSVFIFIGSYLAIYSLMTH